jgi:arabinoxylan arabinofuranohydrolase
MDKDMKIADKELTKTQKNLEHHNPLITQHLGADPYVIIYNERVYVYMTGDVFEYDEQGKVLRNSFSRIHELRVISSDDLVNWTDHGAINAAGPDGAATWGNNSWAPAVAYKEINGTDKFFIYFANGGNGIGVLTSDSPTGPFIDPLGHALISRETPNCSNVAWLFDPAVLVDEDGKAYLYFGGGIPDNKFKNPGTGRVVQLGEDMISIAGDPIALDIPYLFEDSGINKIGNTYYYSYCSNFNVDPEGSKELGFGCGEIIYMTSNHPMGPFKLQGSILKNPGDFFGCYGNNHHCMFQFKGQLYIAYHSQLLEKNMGIDGGYRCTHIDLVTLREDGSIEPIQATCSGVKQLKSLNPYEKTKAVTMATMGGIQTIRSMDQIENDENGNMIVSGIKEGHWIAIKGVEFNEKGANIFKASIQSFAGQKGGIQIRLDHLDGEIIGYLEIEEDCSNKYREIETKLNTTVTGNHNVIFVFFGEGYSFDSWYFQS